MAEAEPEELGPIDYVLIEFPAGKEDFSGEVATELAALADVELIRVLDVLILEKDENGDVEATELGDRHDLGVLRRLEPELADVFAQEDVAHLAAALAPGSVAAAIIWENSWAAPFGTAVRRAGGRLVADGRIPMHTVVDALQGGTASP